MNEEGDFEEIFKVEIDPGDRDFDPEKNTNFYALKKLKKHGDSNQRCRQINQSTLDLGFDLIEMF
ncbi:hypothetical protein QBC36DRAFT_291157, partial [Triangularia setosa]